MEVLLAVFPLKTWIFAAGFGGLFTVLKTKYKNFKLGKEYEQNLKEIKKSYFYTIRHDLEENKKKYLENNLKLIDIRKLGDIIEKIFAAEKFKDLIDKKVKEFIDKMKFESHTSYFNILVIGSTGVGKSTLINSVLKLDENSPNCAKVGKGEPVTLGEPSPYTSDKVKGLKLWDSQGIDKSNYGIEKLKKSVTNLINKNANDNNPDNFIHCIWYCVTQHRFEKVEKELLKNLMEIYNDENLPIIIVYTQCISEEQGENMMKEIDKICMNKKIKIIPILAKDQTVGKKTKPIIIKKYGIDELLDYSFEKIEGAVQSACFHSIRQQIENNYDSSIKKKGEKIDISKAKNLNKLDTEKLKEKILKFMEIIVNILIFEEDQTKSLSENSKSMLLNFLDEYIKKCTEQLNKFIEKKVLEKSVELANTYLINQKDIKEKSDEINNSILNNITEKILDNISIFKTIGLDTGSKEINSKYKQLEEWQKISEDELSKEFNQKLEKFFNYGITKFIVETFIELLKTTMSKSFKNTFKIIDNYMIEKTGEQIKAISKNIILQIKENTNKAE